MNIDMSEANSILVGYAEEARQSKSAANEIVEEVLHALGYSKRDKDNVHKLFNQQFDWNVKSKGVVICVQVNKLGTDIKSVFTEDIVKQAIDMRANVLIITDSQLYDVYRYSSDKKEYIKVDSIDIADLTERNERVLTAISFDGINIKEIDAILSEGDITKAEALELISKYIEDNKGSITEFICEQKPACPTDLIMKSVDDCVETITVANLKPDDIRLRYEQAERKYIDAINSKDSEIYALKKEISALSDKNVEIQKELDVLSKKDYKHAVETIEFIAKNSGDNSKRFISYINDEIYTSSKLHKFVGEMLQRLYAIKSVEAHTFIFDGEYFRLNSSNAKHNDMVIKNTVYDIMVNEEEADDALIRLRAIYSHFPDIVFACMETGFGNTKHNTGITDAILEDVDEYSDYECDDIEIIESREYIPTETIESDSTDTDLTVEPETVDNKDILEDVAECSIDDDIVEEVKSLSIPEETADIVDIEDDHSEDASSMTTEAEYTADECNAGETVDISKLIIDHIIGLNCEETKQFKLIDDINIEEYSIVSTEDNGSEPIVETASTMGMRINAELESVKTEPVEAETVVEVEEIAVDNGTCIDDTEIMEIDEGQIISVEQVEDEPVEDTKVDDTIESCKTDIELVAETKLETASTYEGAEDTESKISLTKEPVNEIIDAEDVEDIVEVDACDEPEETNEIFGADFNQAEDSNSKESCSESTEETVTDTTEEICDSPEYTENRQYDDSNEEVEPVLIVTALSAANSLVSDYMEDIEFNNIEAITAEEVAFDVNSNYEDLTYDELLVKSLNAVLAIDIYSDLESKVVTKLKHKRLDEISDFIQVRSADLAEFPSIAGTKYVVCGIENLNDLVYTLTRICQAIEIDIDKVYMFMTITTNSDIIIDNYGTTFESIQFRHTVEEYTPGANENTTISLIRGELFNNLLVTGESIKAYADIFKRVLGVKTGYMELNIDGNKYTGLDAISFMIREAENRNIDLETIRFGTAFGDNHKLISFDMDEVGDNPKEIELYNGDILYCASLTEWQTVVAIIRVHNILFKNSPIVVKTQVDMDAINFYGSAYDTEIATDSLAICGLAHYVRTHFPN